MKKYLSVIDFYFGVLKNPNQMPVDHYRWFRKDPDLDQMVREKFEEDIYLADQGKYQDWKESGLGYLALIILFDQFPRNIFRESAQAFAYDSKALMLSKEGCSLRKDKELFPIQRTIFYMPLMHSENLQDHSMFTELCSELVDLCDGAVQENVKNSMMYLEKHSDIIKQFGRYPHRNGALSRVSTPEEIEFVKNNGGF